MTPNLSFARLEKDSVRDPRQRALVLRYGVALLAVACGWGAREALGPLVGETGLPFITFFPAVAWAAWYGGVGPAILAIVLSTVVAGWEFHAPSYELRLGEPAQWVFAFSAGVVAAAVQQMHRARRALMETRDTLATTLASIGDGVIVTDAQGRVAFLNAEAERLTGWRARDAASRPLPEVFVIVNEHNRTPAEDPVSRVLRERAVVGLANHTILIGKDGRETPIDDSASPVQRSGEPLLGVVLVFRDVGAQRAAEAARARLAAIVESSGDAIVAKDLQGIIRSWNAAAERLFGYTAAEIVGQSVLTLIPPEHRAEEEWILEQLRAGKPAELIETTRLTKDGRRLPVSVRISPILDRKGEVIGASTIVRDLSDLVAARDGLERERNLLATTLASIGDAVVATDEHGRVTFLNPAAHVLTGWAQDDAAGQPLTEVFRIINEVTREEVENPALRAMRLGMVVGLANQTVLLGRDGVERPIDDSAAPIRDADGQVRGSVLVFRDITERRRSEAALRESEARFRDALEGTPVAVFNCDRELRYTWVHNPQPPLPGPAEMLGKRDDELLAREAVRDLVAMKERVLASGTGERRIIAIAHEGATSYFDCAIEPMRDTNGAITGVRGAMTDVTERRRVELERERLRAELAAKVEELQALIDIAPVQIWFADSHRDRLTGNRRAHEQQGMPYGIGVPLSKAIATVPEGIRIEADGRELRPDEMPMAVALRTGKPIHGFEHDVVDARGRRRTMWSNVAPLFDADGRVRGAVGACIEVTELKAAERALREADQRKNEFIATLAHELRNPLAPIRNAVALLQLEGPPDERLSAARGIIERQVQIVSRLLDDLLDVNRLARQKLELRRERVQLASIIQRAIETTRPSIDAARHTLAVDVRDDVVVDADPIRLAQVFANLLSNAAKYMDPGGRIWLEARRSGSEVLVAVRDAGIGIPPEQQSRLFEMFTQLPSSTRRAQGGIGIGLALAKELVELHGGRISVYSAGEGQGSEFIVSLPVVAAAPSARPPAPDPVPRRVRGTPRRVLIADDVRDNADTLAMVLRALGHDVTVVYDGAEALAAAERLRPEVVILDIGMPGMNGYEVCRRIRAHPWGRTMHLIAQTGWGQEEDQRSATAAGFDRHLLKPIDCTALLGILANLPTPVA